jgi:hypothetical protein
MTVKGHLIVCNYCGTRFSDDGYVSEAIKETRDPSLRSNVILAYKMSDKDAENVFYEWLKGGDFTPADINEAATVTEAKKLYIPGWFLKGTYEGSWTASSGYDRKEEYQVWEEHYRTVNDERQPVNELVTKTRIVTDWRPSSGNLHGVFSTLKFANDKIDANLSTFIADKTQWNSNDLVDFESFDNTAYEFVPFQLPYEQCYERYKPELNAIIRNSFTVPGDRYTDLSINSTASYNATQIYYPVYVYEYSYKGERHKAIIDGRDRLNIYGTRPKDETIIKKATLSFAPLILTTILSYIALFMISVGFVAVLGEGYRRTDELFIPTVLNLLISLGLTITFYNIGYYKIRNMVKKSHQARGNTSSVYNDLDTETAAIRHKIMNSGKANFWVHFVIILLVSIIILLFAYPAWTDSREQDEQLVTAGTTTAYIEAKEEIPSFLDGTNITTEFTDRNFRSAVFKALGISEYVPITSEAVATIKELDIRQLSITDLSGIEYFTSLEYLYCPYNQITNIPELPKTLKSLSCEGNQLTSLPELPDSLTSLDCWSNQLTSLPELPDNLTFLDCSYNQLTSLPELPESLTYINYDNNKFSSLSDNSDTTTETTQPTTTVETTLVSYSEIKDEERPVPTAEYYVGIWNLVDIYTSEERDISIEFFTNGNYSIINNENSSQINGVYGFTPSMKGVSTRDDYGNPNGTYFLTPDQNGLYGLVDYKGCVFIRDVSSIERTLTYTALETIEWNDKITFSGGLGHNSFFDRIYGFVDMTYRLDDDNKTLYLNIDGESVTCLFDRDTATLTFDDGTTITGTKRERKRS